MLQDLTSWRISGTWQQLVDFQRVSAVADSEAPHIGVGNLGPDKRRQLPKSALRKRQHDGGWMTDILSGKRSRRGLGAWKKSSGGS